MTRLYQLSPGIAAPIQEPDTLRILAIRIDFQEDDNPLTTGNGKFDLSTAVEPVIDPPPHNATYFEDQLLALSNYYRTVSHRNLFLLADVYPREQNSTYTVSREMSFYVPIQSEELLDLRLAELFEESFMIADASGEIDFSQYDSFIIFHAGVGADFALDFDPTPQDIPSVFLNFETLKELLGNGDPTYEGIPVNGGTSFVREGTILPETQSQEGFEVGLLGTTALMFGSQLGLPVLFNPDNGRAGIGIFGLMDQGSGNFLGLLPTEPCAWSKLFLGWETPVEIRHADDLVVGSSRTTSAPRIYKIPINSNEYFLVENRNRDFNNDEIALGRDANGTRVEFRWDEQGQRILAEEPVGVITQVDEYDFGLPGSGILIWHIDNSVIRATISDNRVNADPDHRGVDLEEADGAQDIGQFYGFLDPGAGAENGVIEDMFWGSNDINLLVNSSEEVAFTPSTTPGSLANSLANTYISLTEFSEPDSVMLLTIHESISQAGFPQFTTGTGLLKSGPVMTNLDDDAGLEIIFTTTGNGDTAQVYVWKEDGSKFIQNSDSAVSGDIIDEQPRPLAIFAELIGTTVFSPAVAGLNGVRVVVAATNESVAAFLPEDNDADGRADALFVSGGGLRIATDPVIHTSESDEIQILVGDESGSILAFDLTGSGSTFAAIGAQAVAGLSRLSNQRIAAATREGNIALLNQDGSTLWQNELNAEVTKSPVCGDLDRDGQSDVIAFTLDGRILAFDLNGELLAGFPHTLGTVPATHPAIADVDQDGFLDIVFSSEDKLFCLNRLGVTQSGFPILLGDEGSAPLSSSAILADIDGDNKLEIVIGSQNNRLEAFDSSGKRVAGFPLSAGGTISSGLTASDIDNDGDIDIAAAADDGFVYVYDLSSDFTQERVPWGAYLADEQHSNANLRGGMPPTPSGDLMPSKLVYNYPNPTEGTQTTIRYRLNFPAEVNIKIYTLTGTLVEEFGGPGFGQVDNEVAWGLQNIESGVYLARVEAEGEGMRDVVVFKIAVIK